VRRLPTARTYSPTPDQPIPPGATYDSLAPVLANEGSQLLVEVMERIVAGTVRVLLVSSNGVLLNVTFRSNPHLQNRLWKKLLWLLRVAQRPHSSTGRHGMQIRPNEWEEHFKKMWVTFAEGFHLGPLTGLHSHVHLLETALEPRLQRRGESPAVRRGCTLALRFQPLAASEEARSRAVQ